MIDGLKPYPKMKDSGVPWLGEVPEHWEVQRLRNLADMRVSNVDKHTKDDEQPVRLCNYVDVYKNDDIRPSMSLMRATATKEEIERFRLAEGDVLITKDSEAWNDIGVPALIRESADDLVSGYHLALLRPFRERIAGAFLFRSLQSIGVQYQFHVEANGVTRYGLSHAAIKSVWLPAPPVSEQAAIVRFLDHADRRIRRYIRAKQMLNKLLEEQKQAIIHRVVTRGLDPNVRLTPSGVEWLGDLPEHWEVVKLSRWFRCTSGATPSRSAGGYYDGDIPWIKTGELLNGEIHDAAEHITQKAANDSNLTLLPAGTVLIAMYGQGQTRGRTGLLKIAATVNQAAFAILPNAARATPEFLQLWFISQYFSLRHLSEARNATQPNLNSEIIKSLRIVLPPLFEQAGIVEAVATETMTIAAAIDRARREIDLLREYRTRLIADVVTGKLDVREAAARLPQQAEDIEPLDEPESLGDASDESAGDGLDSEPEEAEA